jgi:hypothetical protein
VKKDPDTLEHFIPIEIGGSGLYYDDPVVVAKRHSLSAVEDEIHYRINQLVNKTWTHKYLRSDKLL